MRGSILVRRSSSAVLSMTRASLGARTVKGDAMPMRGLGSTSQGQLLIRATVKQASSKAAKPPARQRTKA